MSGTSALEHWEGRPVEAWRSAWRLPALTILASVASTNDLLRDQALAGAAAGSTVLADHQTAGRGRLGRTWHTPAGRSLLGSVLLRPQGGEADAAAALSLRIGLALAEAIEQSAPVRVALKWPNDVLVDGAKVAGILCEAAVGFVVAGIGVNVAQQPAELPRDVDPPATSLAVAAGREVSRSALAGALFDSLRPLFTAPSRPLDQDELGRFAARDALRDRAVTVDGMRRGTARGLDPRGALVLEQDGRRRLLHAGTVRSLP